jgi:hypothetical protein
VHAQNPASKVAQSAGYKKGVRGDVFQNKTTGILYICMSASCTSGGTGWQAVLSTSGSGAGEFVAGEGAAPTGDCAAGYDVLWADSTLHGFKFCANGGSADAVVGAATSATLTNKTYDAEGTGNVITFPVKVFLLAAGCNNTTAASMWDLPTSTPAAAACVTGSNTQKGVLDFADTSGGFSAQNTLLLPADFSGAIDARIIWTTTATSGNAKWSLSTVCTDVAASATDDPAFNTASTVTTAAPGTGSRVQTSSITGVTTTGCAAGNLLHVKIFRDGNDGSDTIAATARLIGIELTIRRAM